LFIPNPDPGSGFCLFTHPGSRIRGSKRHWIHNRKKHELHQLLSVLRYKELKKENETLKAELESLETGREELQAGLRIRIRIRIRIRSGFNRVSGSGSGIRIRIQEGKNDPQK
jgi:hypothetical protein